MQIALTTAKRLATPLALATAISLLLAACGGSKSSTTTTPASHTQTTATVASSGHAASANIAVVDGTPITFGTYAHWMKAAETSNATQDHQTFTIIPLWPPDFSSCVSEVRANVPSYQSKSTATLTSDCQKLFTALNTDTLNFLIQGQWFELYAAAHGITVTQALIKQILGSQAATTKANTAAAGKLIDAAESAYKAKTVCAKGYATSYCVS